MMNEDDFSEAPEESETPNLDIEDGLSYASSQVPDGRPSNSTNNNPSTDASSLLGDTISTTTPTTRNPSQRGEDFQPEVDDVDEGYDTFETNVVMGSSKQPISDSEDSNTKLDKEIAKIQDEVDAEEKAFAASVAAATADDDDDKYDLSRPVSNSGTYDLGRSAEYDLGAPPKKSEYDLGKAPQNILGGKDDDDNTSLTLQRSGASDFALHNFMKQKNWRSIREFFEKPHKDNEKILRSIHFANEDGETPLHIAARRKCPLDIIKMITERGGRKTVLACNNYGKSNCLHHACHFNAPEEVVDHLIDVGGAEAVRARDDIGNTPLQWALSKRLPVGNIKHLIEIGGKQTASMENRIGWTPLHTASYFDADLEVIKYIVGITNNDSVRVLDKKFRTPIDLMLERNSFRVDSIIVLLQQLSEIDEVALYLPQNTINAILEWARLQTTTVALECPIVQRILNETFISRKYLTVWMVDLYLQIFVVAMFSFGMDSALRRYEQSIGTAEAVFLYISVSWFLGREAIQLITTPFNEFAGDFKNWLDFTQVIMLFLSLDILVLRGGVRTQADASTIIVTAGLVWINLLSVLGKAFYRIRVFIVSLQTLIWNLMPLFIGSTCIIAAFAQMYYISNNYFIGTCTSPMIYTEDQDWTCTLGDTYFMTFASIITGHWRFMEQPSGSAMTALSFSLAVITVLLLFTSLIGQVFALNGEIQEKGRISFWTNRLYTIIEISDFNETFGCGCCRTEIADDDKPRWKTENRDHETPKARFSFDKADKYRSFPDDDDLMRAWWTGDDDRVPAFQNRAGYFLKWAPVSEILVPGRTAERMLAGHPKNVESYMLRLLSYIFFPLLMSIWSLIFALGLATFGLLWPRDMKRRLFCGTEAMTMKQKEDKTQSQFDGLKNAIEAIRSEVKGEKILKETLETNMAQLQDMFQDMNRLLKNLGDDITTNSIDDEEEA